MRLKARYPLALALLLAVLLVFPACSAANVSGASASASASTAPVQSPESAKSSEVATASSEQLAESPAVQEPPVLAITANGTTFLAAFDDNSSAEALVALLQDGPLTLSLHDYGDFEKVGSLGTGLPTNDEEITTQAGDVILYQGNQITIYYDTNTWSFTRIAHIDDVTRDTLLEAFGPEDVEVTFSLQ